MQVTTQASEGPAAGDPALAHAGPTDEDAFTMDPLTLAQLDYGLFRALLRLGTSKQRICSALCLSYAEYDYIVTRL
jgi:hypothetical protein